MQCLIIVNNRFGPQRSDECKICIRINHLNMVTLHKSKLFFPVSYHSLLRKWFILFAELRKLTRNHNCQ